MKHSDIKSIICAECGKYFKSKQGLEYHMKKKYGEYNEQCKSSDFKAITKLAIKIHVMKIHSKYIKFNALNVDEGLQVNVI